MSPSTENYYEPSIETASKCVTTVSNLVRGLKKIDELIETDWLNEEIFMRHFIVVTGQDLSYLQSGLFRSENKSLRRDL